MGPLRIPQSGTPWLFRINPLSLSRLLRYGARPLRPSASIRAGRERGQACRCRQVVVYDQGPIVMPRAILYCYHRSEILKGTNALRRRGENACGGKRQRGSTSDPWGAVGMPRSRTRLERTRRACARFFFGSGLGGWLETLHFTEPGHAAGRATLCWPARVYPGREREVAESDPPPSPNSSPSRSRSSRFLRLESRPEARP